MSTPVLQTLIKALQCLPGIGPKSAQRAAYYLLERNREGARRLARSLEEAMTQVGHCESCRTFSENPRCRICDSPDRDPSTLCVVETPLDAGLPSTDEYPLHAPPDVRSSTVAIPPPFEPEESTMAGKTPQKAAAKKAGKSLKEKRAVKKEKKDNRGGSSIL